MVKWFIHRFPKLAKLFPILRVLEIVDMAISFYDRLPTSIKWGVSAMFLAIWTWLVNNGLVIWSLVDSNWIGFIVALSVGLLLFLPFYYISWKRGRPLSPTESTADNQDSLKLEIRGRFGGNSRIFDTPEGENPPWILHDPLFADGILWDISLLIVNREQHPVDITVTLAKPIDKNDVAKRYRIPPLLKPIYEHCDAIKRYMYLIPEHLAFPVPIESGKHIYGHAEFAINGTQHNMLGEGYYTKVVGGSDYILEFEDLLSGKKVEFAL